MLAFQMYHFSMTVLNEGDKKKSRPGAALCKKYALY